MRKLASRLEQSGAKIWIDEAEINIGDSLIQKIGDAIDNTDFVAVVLSTQSVNSEWVQRELRIALSNELSSRRDSILPILYEKIEMPAFLRDKVYADFSRPELCDESFKRLLRAVGLTYAANEPFPISLTPTPPPQRELADSERRLLLFEDIFIKGLDENQCFQPDPSVLLFHLYLQLSALPPYEWTQIFDAERRFPRHSKWRRSWVEGSYIIARCVPNELAEFLLADLKEDVQNVNLKWREYLAQLAKREIRDRECAREKHANLSSLKQYLDFG